MWKWVTKTGRYYYRDFIHKKTGKMSESIIGRKHELNLLEKEMYCIAKELHIVKKEVKSTINTADISCEKMKILSKELNSVIHILKKR